MHAQGIIHRDIKPDNCLITDDDVLKIVDFGVSEMFEKDSEMKTKKSAGSPAFMPPELCVPKHGDVSGKAAFEKTGMIELYDAIRSDNVTLEECEEDFADLMHRILEKDPDKRITMDELRVCCEPRVSCWSNKLTRSEPSLGDPERNGLPFA